MSTVAYNIKTNIKGVLDDLVTSGTLSAVIERDLSKDPFQMDIPSYPVAILGMPSIQSVYETNRANQRTYFFEILFMQQGYNLSTQRDVEELIDKILNAFDNDPTLSGAADVASEPSVSAPEAVSTADKTWIVFTVTIKARALADLTFG